MKKTLYHLEYILIIPIAIMLFIAAKRNLVLWSVGATFLIEAIAYLLLAINNHKIKIASGIINFINGAGAIAVLLLLAISELPSRLPMYLLIYVIAYSAIKIIMNIFYLKNKDDLTCIIYKEYGVVMIMLIINLIACMLFYSFSSEENLGYMTDVLYRIFIKQYKGYDTLKFTLLLIKIVINFITSNFVAYYSASSLILIIKDKPLHLKNKIKAIIDFIQKYQIGFIIGEIVTSIICVSYFLQYDKSDDYKVLFYFFLLIFVLRTLIFIWNLIIKKKYKNDPYKAYRINFILLIIVSASFIIFNDGLNSVLITISAQRNNSTQMPLWWLFLIILPFTSYGFVNAIMSYHRAKIDDDASLLASGNLSFVTSMYSFFGAALYLIVKFGEQVAVVVWFILIGIVTIAQFYVCIKSLIIGIKGILGKRKKREEFIIDSKIEDDIENKEEVNIANE